MSNSKKAISLAALGLATVLTLMPAAAQAQRYSSTRYYGSGYRLPGSYTRVYPAPRAVYRVGGMTIYQGRGSNCNPWPYGYSRGYYWPYGYSRDYSWPYGTSSSRYRSRR
jgi:hypothetical protein